MTATLLAVGVLCGCGHAPSTAGNASADPPPGSTPGRGDPGPPPAWLETAHGSFWLAYSSYCWSGVGVSACADAVATADRTDVPRIRVGRGEVVTVHLAFTPKTAGVSVGGRELHISPSRLLRFRVPGDGALDVFATTSDGDASYAARIALL